MLSVLAALGHGLFLALWFGLLRLAKQGNHLILGLPILFRFSLVTIKLHFALAVTGFLSPFRTRLFTRANESIGADLLNGGSLLGAELITIFSSA
jgi:hypothetical protein